MALTITAIFFGTDNEGKMAVVKVINTTILSTLFMIPISNVVPWMFKVAQTITSFTVLERQRIRREYEAQGQKYKESQRQKYKESQVAPMPDENADRGLNIPTSGPATKMAQTNKRPSNYQIDNTDGENPYVDVLTGIDLGRPTVSILPVRVGPNGVRR